MGIHPRSAAQHHAEIAHAVLREALVKAGISPREADGVAYSAGPGFGPCLRVGASVARAIAIMLKKPLTAVHHAIGHIELAIQNTGFADPLTVLVSGGHTAILALAGGRWRVYGETEDITLGNLLDTFARGASLSSPGGPEIERMASGGRESIELPYVVKGNDVSYSGILTYALKALKNSRTEDICLSLQETAFAILVEATERSMVQTGKKEVLLTGGVAMNRRLRELMRSMCESHDVEFGAIRPEFSGDCGAQISWTGHLALAYGVAVKPERSYVKPKWRLDSVDIPWRKQDRS